MGAKRNFSLFLFLIQGKHVVGATPTSRFEAFGRDVGVAPSDFLGLCT